MTTPPAKLEIFAATAPGLEDTLRDEVRSLGWTGAKSVAGGVTFRGAWHEVWRANLRLRGANRILVRLTGFPARHLADLDERARKVDWSAVLRPHVPVRVEATCHKSRIYHSDAAAERIARGLKASLGATVSDDAAIAIMARIDNDVCTISVDTSGDLLHKRGYKQAVTKAPMRETMAALFLRQCGFSGDEPVVDPMCGSGTFVIEAAEIAAGLAPGRARSFAFEQFANFDPVAWQKLQAKVQVTPPAVRFYGSDRDAGAVASSRANAERAGVSAWVDFRHHAVSDLAPPPGQPGLVIVNPPYGTRIGEARQLAPLYRAFGKVLGERFAGWRVGIVATEKSLVAETGLPFLPPGPPVSHGGLRVTLYRTDALPALARR